MAEGTANGRTDLLHAVEAFRRSYEARDVEAMVALFAMDAEYIAAPGVFRGHEEIRRFLAWDARLSPTAKIADAGIGLIQVGPAVVWERVISLTYKGIPYDEACVAIVEFDDYGLIRRNRSYYDKLDIMDQISGQAPGFEGWITRHVIGFLVKEGNKGLDGES